jgi:UDP-N-acetylglucosamine 2-epimerase (non-hydrolysing)
VRLAFVVGARPNFVKLAALLAECSRRPGIGARIVHTGQHYDRAVSGVFFEELELPPPDLHLGIGAAPPLAQLGRMIEALGPALVELEPDWVVVVGDVTSTLAGAVAASRLGLPLAHVEAGLRSFDPSMPEEVNRRLTDALAHWLFASEESAVQNLLREGVPSPRIALVGNVMIDTLLRLQAQAARSGILDRLGLDAAGYAVLTLHRPSTVDEPERLAALLRAVASVSRSLPVVFPAHPRTLGRVPASAADIRIIDPLGYLDFLRLQSQARFVLTDSGGVQEETTVLGVPCLTLRDRTERPVTVTHGTNRVIGTDPAKIAAACQEVLTAPRPSPARPPLWDGRAAARILDQLERG